MSFQQDFLWGSASAAYQIEGAYQADGKGLSIWDEWVKLPGKTFQGTNGDIACDHYHRYLEDIGLMKEMGLKTYRFSIAWTRILPSGTGEINPAGIAFYNNLINALIDAGIEPMVTLYHWDLPLELQRRYEGWLGAQVVEDFVEYAQVCFQAFGDRVKYWIVMNEPNIFTSLGYQMRLHPPGVCDDAQYLLAFHHTVLAHAKTVVAFKKGGYGGMIGSSIAFTPGYARSDSAEDQRAKHLYDVTGPLWFLDSYYRGVYPEDGVSHFTSVGVMPEVCASDRQVMIEGARLCDFIGINYYQTAMLAHNPRDGVGFTGMNTDGKKGSQSESGVPGLFKFVKNPSVTYTDWDWAIDPKGLTMALKWLYARYSLPLVISENGLGAYDVKTPGGTIHDGYRIDFLSDHIAACEEAVASGVKLLAYCTWSFTDLLSWLNGFQKRYGFVHIDFEETRFGVPNLARTKKASFYWYQSVIAKNGLR